MPLDDAIDLVVSSFESYIQSQREKAAAPPAATTAAAPGSATARAAPPPFIPPSSDVSYLLNLLADNRQLTVEEIEKVVDYLQERKNKMLVAEGRQPSTPAVNSKLLFIMPPTSCMIKRLGCTTLDYSLYLWAMSFMLRPALRPPDKIA